ncbi:hypothetical protein [Yersinia intermedia]|uniref:Uncharacterized protein n=1 Tax=Yersinia intermedia TaxID=631 RepID=A0ABX6F3Q0_YERIN|nr:hypothetical protein [Yersinia intermedia]QGR64642.1 hypothetical protein FOC38_01005 [Yersinia intermedia]QGR69658.1 hypothetical protein FOC37_04310 [Yersinia intermedia]
MMDKSILQQINHWAACARLTSECSSVVHADLLEKVASHIISIESLQEETQKERDELKELNCHFDLSIRKTEGVNEVLRSKLEAAERALIKPLPIGELVHRLEGQTYEKWFSESDVKDLRERAEKAEAALSAANEPWRSFVTNDDISALNRFAECCDDPESGGHDLDKDQVERLVSIGALRKTKRNYHETTDFGDFVISAGFTVEGNADAE